MNKDYQLEGEEEKRKELLKKNHEENHAEEKEGEDMETPNLFLGSARVPVLALAKRPPENKKKTNNTPMVRGINQ